MLKLLLIKLLDFYSYFISPIKPPSCRFIPTCSNYARISIENYGVIKGGILTLKRLLRCQPFCEGGFDPVPERLSKENING